MDVTQIPFNKFIEISQSNFDGYSLQLGFTDNMKNHLGSFHASAQFAFAEACSGLSLQKHFPHLKNAALPLLRKSEVKFIKIAQSDIFSKANIDLKEKVKFEKQFHRKGRATIVVIVEIFNQNGTVTMSGEYEWFIQKIED
jgi:acyl-coenzyme A thioesterase PaaI-like protein